MLLLIATALANPGAEHPPVLIPAGEAVVGSDDVPDQAPRRTLRLDAFRLAPVEVSVGDWAAFTAAGGYAEPAHWSEAGLAWLADTPGAPTDAGRRAMGRSPDHPVVNVSYYEAEAYCAWDGGRLPTEWEWERAARGADGVGHPYPWGAEVDVQRANWYHADKVAVIRSVTTQPVAGGPDPVRGLRHMAGNVWEWTSSAYSASDEADFQVARGGSWMNLWSYCTTSWREPVPPADQRLTVGVRCAY